MKKIIILILTFILSQSNLAFANTKYYQIEQPSYSGDKTYTVIYKKNIYVRDKFSKTGKGFARKRPKVTNAELHKMAMHRIEQRKAYRNAKTIAYEPPKPVTISNLHKDYTIQKTRQISCHGVTYYGNINICK